MKEKIKKFFQWFLKNWRIFAEIGTVVWAIQGMWKVIAMFNMPLQDFVTKNQGKIYFMVVGENNSLNLFLVHLLFYFLSAILILYLLRRKNNQKPNS